MSYMCKSEPKNQSSYHSAAAVCKHSTRGLAHGIRHVVGQFLFFLKVLPPYHLAGFDLTTHSSSLHGGRLR
jgi:hypothetical protein